MTRHYEELDSLRGLCALTVVWCHFLGSYPLDTPWLWVFTNTPLAILRTANSGVIFFFLLSGFVLSLSFLGEKKHHYFPYALKRVFRLYPAYIAAVFAAFLVKYNLLDGPIPGYSDHWINAQWTHPATWKVFADHLPLVTRFRTSYLNPPIWSLVVEMRISLIFPLLMLLFFKLRNKAVWSAVIVSIASGFAYYYLKANGANKDLQSVLNTASFVCFFVMGICLADARQKLCETFQALAAWPRRLLVLAGLLLYSNDLWIAALFPRAAALNPAPVTNFITGAGASVILIWAISVRSFLLHPAVHFFGKISYSLYLWHMVALYGSIALLHAVLPIWQVLCAALAATILLSALSYRFIEIPTMRLGRSLSHSLAGWIERRRTAPEEVLVKEP